MEKQSPTLNQATLRSWAPESWLSEVKQFSHSIHRSIEAITHLMTPVIIDDT